MGRKKAPPPRFFRPTTAGSRALALGLALVLAKLLVVALRWSDGITPPASVAALPLVLVYQDAWLVLAFAGVDLGVQRLTRHATTRLAHRILYGVALALVVYAALNIPIARLLSTPLTASMLAAVGGALSDSAGAQLTLANVLAMLAPPLAFVVAAHALHPRPRALGVAALGAALVSIIGPLLLPSVATLGVHRNALVGLVETALPASAPVTPTSSTLVDDARALPDHGPALDLRHLAGAAKGKSVLFIVLESTGARRLKTYDPTLARDPTPNLTRLMAGALVFDRVRAPYPESIKGMYAWLCSEPPLPQAPAERHAAARHRAACISSVLHARGYATGLFNSGHFAYLGMRDVVADRDFDVSLDALQIGGPHLSSFGTDDRETARRLLAWLDTLPRERAFFAAFMPIAGHHPYRAPGDAPRPYPDVEDRDAYDNDLHVGDVATGLLLDGLARRGRLADTLVVVFGDHGQAFHEHPGNFAHTLFVYEENLHVPLAIVLPGGGADPLIGARVPQRGTLVDVAPTVLALLGLPPEALHVGRSLLAPRSPPEVAFTDHRALQLAAYVGDAAGDWKLVLDVDGGRAELYDLARDPLERRDLAATEPARVERFTRFLTAWRSLHYQRFLARDVAPPPPP